MRFVLTCGCEVKGCHTMEKFGLNVGGQSCSDDSVMCEKNQVRSVGCVFLFALLIRIEKSLSVGSHCQNCLYELSSR